MVTAARGSLPPEPVSVSPSSVILLGHSRRSPSTRTFSPSIGSATIVRPAAKAGSENPRAASPTTKQWSMRMCTRRSIRDRRVGESAPLVESSPWSPHATSSALVRHDRSFDHHLRSREINRAAAVLGLEQELRLDQLAELQAQTGPLAEMLRDRNVAALPRRLADAEVLIEGHVIARDCRLIGAGFLPDIVGRAVDCYRSHIVPRCTVGGKTGRLGAAPILQDVVLAQRLDGPTVDPDVHQPGVARLRLGKVGGKRSDLGRRFAAIEAEADAR